MNTTKTNNLSFYNDQGILTMTAKQFDTGRLFVFHIMDNDSPLDLSGCTAYLRIAKADGTQFQGHECCTVECSKVIINTSVGNGSQILTAAGINVCELHLKDANDIALTTWTFHIVVEPRVHDGSHMSSIDSYDVLDNMITMEKERIANEKQRKENEENRKAAFEQKIGETNTVITECRLVIDTANQKINSFDEEINEIVNGITDEAQSYANNAKVSETNAANAASRAADSANTASQKASDAAASATLSQSYAVGGTQSRAGEDVDNAKYYSEKAQETLENFQKTVVTGVKGEFESTYRTGNVNLTAENIGALPLNGGTVNGRVTINDVFTVDKTIKAESPEQNMTEFMVERNKVKINSKTISDGNVRELARFEGDAETGNVKIRGKYFYNYCPFSYYEADVAKVYYKNLRFDGTALLIQDNYDNGISVGSGDIYIGAINNTSGRHTEKLVVQSGAGTPQTRLYTKNFKIGYNGNYFLDYQEPSSGKRFKLRYGVKGSNIEGAPGYFGMFVNDNGVQLINENSIANQGEWVNVWLNKDDGTSVFETDVILTNPRGINHADLYLQTGNIYGQRDAPYNHAIKMGHAGDDYMAFYEYGALWMFCQGENLVALSIRYEQDNERCIVQGRYSRIIFDDIDDDLLIDAGGYLEITVAGEKVCFISPLGIMTYIDSECDLGTSSRKWRNVYAANGTIQTSDRNKKNSIEELSSEKAEQFIYGLKPSTYKMNTGTSNRTHWGMISQDIEELFEEIGMTSLDFAGFIKSPKVREITEDENGNPLKKPIEEIVEGEYDYSLRYDEFIAPIIKVIQKQHEEIQNLKQDMAFFKQQK